MEIRPCHHVPDLLAVILGSQFTSFEFTGVLTDAGVAISMDGRGRCMDNIFIERLWHSLKYEAVYLHEMTDGFVAERVISEWIAFYNTGRSHSALGGATPAEAYASGHPARSGPEEPGDRLGRPPGDMMDKACALPTSPQGQQQQKAFTMIGNMAA